MTSDASGSSSDTGDAPPRFADPRRIGAVIGLLGAAVFVFSSTAGLPEPVVRAARPACAALLAVTLWFLFVRPRPLGPFVPPRVWQVGVYLACVAAEFALIALGTAWLDGAGRSGLRPALIALVVGLHFLPFAWAFHERMFTVLGAIVALLGGVGLLLGTPQAANASAVAAGLAMAGILLAYAPGGGRSSTSAGR